MKDLKDYNKLDSIDKLEMLLREKSEVENPVTQESFEAKKQMKKQTSDKSANLTDFIDMIAKIVSKSMKNRQVEFSPDEGKRIINDPEIKIDHPYITYKVIDRRPKKELKPRERESYLIEHGTNEKDTRKGRIYGQRFQCIVQFNIIASTYRDADEIMEEFEDMIVSYTHYFKRNGVGELLFEKHFTDENYDMFRQELSVRNLQYYVEVEKLTVLFDDEIDEIRVI